MTGNASAEACAHGRDADATHEAEEAIGEAQQSREAELQAWLTLGGHAIAVVDQLATLLRLELALALADGRRLLVIALAILPLALLAWTGLSVLLGWLVFAGTASVGLGLFGFLLLQLAVLALLLRAMQRLRQSLAFPASRRQLQAILRGETQAPGEQSAT